MTNDFGHQLDKIRVEIYEQTKDRKNAEAVKAANGHGKTLAAKYDIKAAKGISDSPAKSASVL